MIEKRIMVVKRDSDKYGTASEVTTYGGIEICILLLLLLLLHITLRHEFNIVC